MSRVYDAILKLTDKFSAPLQKAAESVDRFEKTYKNTAKAIDKTGKSMIKTGEKLTKAITLPIVGAGIAATKMAIEWEDAFADVKKTFPGTEAELSKFNDTIREMSKEIPVAAEELAAIAAEGGQLGIQSQNLAKFTRTVADLKVATNLGDEGASQMAKFANIVGMSQDNFDRLGSTIVELGNNTATTEADIMNMAMRLAGAGSTVGMTESQILGVSAALSSVGIEAQAGGSAMSKVMIDISQQVELGGDKLKDYAEVCGMTADQFSKMFKDDPTAVIGKFIQGLGSAESQGKSTIGILDSLDLTETRVRDTLLRAAGASDIFTDAIDMGARAWDENSALAEEAAAKYDTTAGQLQILKNTLKDVGRSFGDAFLPYLKEGTEKVKDFAYRISKLDDGTKQNIIKVALALAALGPGLIVVGKLTRGVSKGIYAFIDFGKAAGKAGSLFKLFTSSIVKTKLVALGVVLAIALIVGAIIYLITHWDKVKAKAEEIFPGIGKKVQRMGEIFSEIFAIVVEEGKKFVDGLVEVFNTIVQFCGPILKTFVEIIVDAVTMIGEILDGLIKLIVGVFTGNWQMAWEGVKQIFVGIVTGIKNVFTDMINGVIRGLNSFIDVLNSIKIPDWIPFIGGKGVNIGHIREFGQTATRTARTSRPARSAQTVRMAASGASNWMGGPIHINERGGEIVDLPRGSRVIPHDLSVKELNKGRGESQTSYTLNIPKLADTIVVREETDIDKIVNQLANKLKLAKLTKIGGLNGNMA